MLRFASSFGVSLLVLVTGCGSGGQRVVTGASLFESERMGPALIQSTGGDDFMTGLLRAEDELDGKASASTQVRPLVLGTSSAPARPMKPRQLSASLKQSGLIRKLVGVTRRALKDNREQQDLILTRADFEQFASQTVPLLTAGLADGSSDLKSEAGADGFEADSYDYVQRYLVVYFQGNFVDRNGNEVAKPEIKRTGISNGTINGLFTVVFEAVSDSWTRMPVYFEKKADPNATELVCLTPSGKAPTAVVLDPDLRTIVSDSTPISRNEVDMIRHVSNLAGDESKIVSGFAFRLFSHLQVHFVVGGSFAVGDNDTLKELVDTFFEISSRRITEASASRYFLAHAEREYMPWVKALSATVKQVRMYQSKIKELFAVPAQP